MRLHKVLYQVVSMTQPIEKKLEARLKAWTKPATESLIGGTAADLVKSKPELVVENPFLRQQVIVLSRQVMRSQLTAKDRRLLVLLASRVQEWKNALLHRRSCLHIVKPETLLRWHRHLLAAEIEGTDAQAAAIRRDDNPDQTDGGGEPTLGIETHSRRIVETGYSSEPGDHPTLHMASAT